MINSITLKSTNSLSGETKTLAFGDKTIIIGPKGGGKSTLYDLLANLSEGFIWNTTKDALAKHNLELDSYMIDGEVYRANGLKDEKANKSIKERTYSQRSEIIFQDDPIKKTLDEDEKIMQEKMNLARQMANDEESVNNFVNKIKELYDNIYKVVSLDKVVLNWSKTFEIQKNLTQHLDIIISLNYNNSEIKSAIIREVNQLKDKLNKINLQISEYKNDLQTTKMYSSKFSSQEIENSIAQQIEILLAELNKLKNLYSQKHKKLCILESLIESFGNAYNKKVSEIKKNQSNESSVSSYVAHAKEHFSNMAKALYLAKKSFNEIINEDIVLELNKKIETSNMLELAINEKILLSEELKYAALKKVLFTAKSSQTLVENWIKSAIGSQKDFRQDSIATEIAKVIAEDIKVLANGQNYSDLSLGQRSIYGIKYKIRNSRGKTVFLDQPEDNLDNHTIASELVKIINERNEQVFIVTHNANIGLLTKPDTVVVSEFDFESSQSNPLSQYKIGKLKENSINSEAAHYLEGGLQYIKERLEIIGGE